MDAIFKGVSNEVLAKITKLFYQIIQFINENNGRSCLVLENIEKILTLDSLMVREKFHDGTERLVRADILKCEAVYYHYEHKRTDKMEYAVGLGIAKKLGFKVVDSADVAVLATGCVCCEVGEITKIVKHILNQDKIVKLVIIHQHDEEDFLGFLAELQERGIDISKIFSVNDMYLL